MSEQQKQLTPEAAAALAREEAARIERFQRVENWVSVGLFAVIYSYAAFVVLATVHFILKYW